MKGKNTFLFAVAILFWLAGSASAYRQVIDLGTLPGYNRSEAYSINDSGQVVGWATDGSGDGLACLFDATGGGANKNLGTLGGDYSKAYSINDKGQIVGWAHSSSGWEGYPYACLFDPTGGGANIDLKDIGWASSINDNGQIVGTSLSGGMGLPLCPPF